MTLCVWPYGINVNHCIQAKIIALILDMITLGSNHYYTYNVVSLETLYLISNQKGLEDQIKCLTVLNRSLILDMLFLLYYTCWFSSQMIYSLLSVQVLQVS